MQKEVINAQELEKQEKEQRVDKFQEQIIAKYGDYTFYKIERQGGGNIIITIETDSPAKNYFNMFKAENNEPFVFWSDCGQDNETGDTVARTIAEKIGGLTLSMIKFKNNIRLCSFNKKIPKSINEFQAASAFMAANAKGKVYFVAPEGSSGGDFWQNIELPTLLANPEVTEICRIDASVYNQIKNLNRDNDSNTIETLINDNSLVVFNRNEYENNHPNFRNGEQNAINAARDKILSKTSIRENNVANNNNIVIEFESNM